MLVQFCCSIRLSLILAIGKGSEQLKQQHCTCIPQVTWSCMTNPFPHLISMNIYVRKNVLAIVSVHKESANQHGEPTQISFSSFQDWWVICVDIASFCTKSHGITHQSCAFLKTNDNNYYNRWWTYGKIKSIFLHFQKLWISLRNWPQTVWNMLHVQKCNHFSWITFFQSGWLLWLFYWHMQNISWV